MAKTARAGRISAGVLLSRLDWWSNGGYRLVSCHTYFHSMRATPGEAQWFRQTFHSRSWKLCSTLVSDWNHSVGRHFWLLLPEGLCQLRFSAWLVRLLALEPFWRLDIEVALRARFCEVKPLLAPGKVLCRSGSSAVVNLWTHPWVLILYWLVLILVLLQIVFPSSKWRTCY